jgi:predicted porin
MKKSFLALALMGAFSGAAFAQSNVTIYGLVDAGIQSDSNGNPAGTKLSLDSGLQSGSRLGFKGTEDLGNGLKANFVLEMGIKVDDGTSDQGGAAFGRQAFVGLSGDFGTTNLGLQKSLPYVASETIDPFGVGLAGNMNRMFGTVTRVSNAVTYSTTNLNGFVGSAQYGFGEKAGDNTANRTVAASGAYTNGPLAVSLTYESAKDQFDNDATYGKKLLVGGVYDFGVAKLHAAYEDKKGTAYVGSVSATSPTIGLEQRVWMIGTTVPFGPGAFLADYTRVNDKVMQNANSTQIALGYTYSLSKRTNLYTSFSRTTNDANGMYNVAVVNGVPVFGATDKLYNFGICHAF